MSSLMVFLIWFASGFALGVAQYHARRWYEERGKPGFIGQFWAIVAWFAGTILVEGILSWRDACQVSGAC